MKRAHALNYFWPIKKQNGHILLNIIGLSLSLASVLFITIWIRHQLSFESFNEKADRVFRVETLLTFAGEPVVWDVVPGAAPMAMKQDFPEIDDIVIMRATFQPAIAVDDKLFELENLFYSTDSYFNIFSVRLVHGGLDNLLDRPGSVVISERASSKLFGNDDPIGKTILLNNEDLLTVTGVMENPRTNTHLKVDFLVSFSLLVQKDSFVDNWGDYMYISYLLLNPKVDANDFNNKLDGYIQSKEPRRQGRYMINPIKRINLYRDSGFESPVYPSNEEEPISSVILFGVIGIMLLLIASINFINLSTAYSTERAREIGIKKVNGASRLNLIFHLFHETLGQAFLAMIIAIMLMIALLPVFCKVSGLFINISSLFMPGNVLAYLLVTLVMAIFAGFYPAIVLSSYGPIKALKPQPIDKTQGAALRKILVVIQFTLATGFIFCTIIMNRQLHFMQQKDIGFSKENIMVLYPKGTMENSRALARQIKDVPGVIDVGIGSDMPVRLGYWTTINRWDGNWAEEVLKFHRIEVDEKYMDILGFDMERGSKLGNDIGGLKVIVNESGIKAMGMEDPLGKGLWLNSIRYTIVGVVKDFHFRKLSEEVLPLFFIMPENIRAKKIFIKFVPGSQLDVVAQVTRFMTDFNPGFPARYTFLNDEIRLYYQDEERLNSLISITTILTIIISTIGLFSLTAFSIRKRKKEIGIRKGHGATTTNLMYLLLRDFFPLLMIAASIAFPIGYYVMGRWLETYAYHIIISSSYFIFSAVLIAFIASLTIISHVVKIANINPVESLRSE